jgi:choline dehydrogenase
MIENDDELKEFIKENFGHNHHQQSSLRMAPLHQGGVVDRFGNVHGVVIELQIAIYDLNKS